MLLLTNGRSIMGTSWVDLTNTGIHDNTSTDTLSITNATPADNGNQYRVVMANNGYACGNDYIQYSDLDGPGKHRHYQPKDNTQGQ